MRNIFKYIFLAVFISVMSSCALDEPMLPDQSLQENFDVEFIVRNTNFIKSSVPTKSESAGLSAIEDEIYSAFFLVYDSEGKLIKYVNLADDISKGPEGLSQTLKLEKGLQNVTVCYLANFPENFVRENMTATAEERSRDESLTDLKKFQATEIEFIARANTRAAQFQIATPSESSYVGVPIVDVDNNGTPTGSLMCMPMLGVWQGDLNNSKTIEVPLKRLFSKVAFTVKLDLPSDSETSSMTLNSLTVNRSPRFVNLFPKEEESRLAATGTQTSQFLIGDYIIVPNSNLEIQNKESATFYFYVPEFVVFPIEERVNDFKNQGKYKEQYKPHFIGSKKATNVVLNASILNQGQELNVTYTVYLGENEIDNFTLKRNNVYENVVTVRGFADGTMGADNRVTASYDGFVVALKRSTLLDSHFEVRPIRVAFSPEFLEENNNKPVEFQGGVLSIDVLGPDSEDPNDAPGWLRLERPRTDTKDEVYCLSGAKEYTYTKRRYFTTDLVTGTLAKNGVSISYDPFASATDSKVAQGDLNGDIPIWLYIDEYSAASSDAYDVEEFREARVRITYTPKDPNATKITQFYDIKQRAIYPVNSVNVDNKVYGIEFFEEYLHDYDILPKDDWGTEGGEYYTSQEGVEWGLDGVTLSHLHRAAYVDYVQDISLETGNSTVDRIANALVSRLNSTLRSLMTSQMDRDDIYSPYYDFYLPRDNAGSATSREYAGLEFNTEIISKMKSLYNSESDADKKLSLKLDGLSLTEHAKSVISYCYNKNKRNADGVVETLHWYAPAIDEIEDVAQSAYHEFDVFQEQKYWSCQPAFQRGRVTLDYVLYVYFSDPKKKLFVWDADGAIDADSESSGTGYYQIDDVLRARATSIDEQGKNIVSAVASDQISYELTVYGDDDYYYDAKYGSRWGIEYFSDFVENTSKSTSKWGTDYDGDGEDDGPRPTNIEINYNNYPGILPRSGEEGKARVRCIYDPQGVSLAQ